MNQLLAKSLGVLNGFIALLIISGGALVGSISEGGLAEFAFGPKVIIGSLIGFLIAVILCGIVALFISIHGELQTIRTKMDDLSQ
tara:strand:+ start:284 stop:538 length:255 start_codon:yes stop_codon:yes gene_type:complete